MRELSVIKTNSIQSEGAWVSRAVKFKNIREAAGYLRRLANNASTDIALREKVYRIVFPAAPSRDEPEQALVIAEWVRKNITYVHDPKESYESAMTTLRLGAGDCDAHAVLVCSMLGAVGIKNKMVLVNSRGRWIHIFPMAIVKTPDGLHRMTLDTTMKDHEVRELVNPVALLAASGVTPKLLVV